MSFLERFTSSQIARKASLTLRSMVRSFDRNRFFASCCVRLEPPCTTELARTFSDMARTQAEEVDAVMLEEAAVLGGEHGLDDVVGHLVDRDRFALDDAALADLVALAVEEGDGEIVLRAPVALGFLEGGQGERQHDDAAGRTHGEAFAEQLEAGALPAGEAEAAEEDGERFPDLAGLEAGLVERRIDPRVDRHQARGFRALRFARWQWTVHVRQRPARACFRD